jgi:general secretion pathway protein G
MRRASRRAAREQGFTLIELIVVVAILSILAGAALPVASRVVDRAARQSTRAELAALADAAHEYVRDTLQVPAAIADLERRPSPPVPGWSGPYLTRSIPDGPIGGAPDRSGWEVDGWARPYVVEPFEHGLRVVSLGRNATRDVAGPNVNGGSAGSDDLVASLDVRPVLRERTLDTVGIVNRALDAFHARAGERAGDGAGTRSTEPLTAEVPAALAVLVEEGLLPGVDRFANDAWGRELVADPPGLAPLVRVRSCSMDTDPPAESSAEPSIGGIVSPTGPGPEAPVDPAQVQRSEAWRQLEARALKRP